MRHVSFFTMFFTRIKENLLMKNFILRTLFLFIGMVVLGACDKAPEKEAKVVPETKIDNPLSAQLKALEKAKYLERQMLEAAEEKRKTIDELTK